MTKDADIYTTYYKSIFLIHSILRRSTESLLKHADSAKSDLKNFLGYTLVFVEVLHEHHHNEEHIVFPELAKKNDPGLVSNITTFKDEHAVLIDDMKALEAHTRAGLEDPSKYDAEAFKAIVNKIRALVLPHFLEEEKDSVPEVLKKHLSPQEVDDIIQRILKENETNGNPWRGLVFIKKHLTKEEAKFFLAELPAVPAFLLKRLFWRKHRGFWKYSSCVDAQ
jgi:hemerythrin-like domain-containing protein